VLLLPWHLTDYLADGLNVTLSAEASILPGRPGNTGQPWADLAGVYAALSDAIAAAAAPPVVLSGDCVASLAVIAGFQRRAVRTGLVWFDAHGDFHTEQTTPLPEQSVMLVDGRDLDPPEVTALAASQVLRSSVADLGTSPLPPGPLIIHIDLDVVDPDALVGLRFPARGGPSLQAVADGIAAVAARREIAALDIAATWRPADAERSQTDKALNAVLTAAGLPG
jgi:arginase